MYFILGLETVVSFIWKQTKLDVCSYTIIVCDFLICYDRFSWRSRCILTKIYFYLIAKSTIFISLS